LVADNPEIFGKPRGVAGPDNPATVRDSRRGWMNVASESMASTGMQSKVPRSGGAFIGANKPKAALSSAYEAGHHRLR
jgi:hypothetical protein